MHRDKFTAKIERMIGAIESGQTLVPIRELYVFGSYRRGAIECGDLDLVLVHEPADDSVYDRLGVDSIAYNASVRFHAAMRKTLCKPGERIQFAMTTNASWWIGENPTIKPNDALLLWSLNDRDWRSKLDGIRPDPSAGRFERGHIIDLKRTNSNLSTMNELLWLLKTDRMTLERHSINGVVPILNDEERRRIARAAACKLIGQELLRIIPFAFHWFREENSPITEFGWLNYREYVSDDETHRAHLGKIALHFAINCLFADDQRTKKVCLIAHIRRNNANDMLIFTRGPKWTGDDSEYYNHHQATDSTATII